MKIMKWTIFSRLMTGYLALLVLATGVSIYAIIQLRHVRDVTQSVILVDNPLLDFHKNLSDALLSETRFEKKFVITRDKVLYDGFLKSKAEFEQNLRGATQLADSDALKETLKNVADLHTLYQDRFAEEVGYLTSGREYAAAWYADEKDRTFENRYNRRVTNTITEIVSWQPASVASYGHLLYIFSIR